MPTLHVRSDAAVNLQAIADGIARSKRVVVITGAGISTNCGIPDFRSENGLYSMIQSQYDAALQNPPWEEQEIDDIDDRPKKRRKPGYYYEIVAPCGEVVDVVDDICEESTQDTRCSSRSTSAMRTRSTSSRATSPESSLLSDPPSEANHPSSMKGETSRSEIFGDVKNIVTPARRSSRRIGISPSTASDILSSPPRTPSSSQSSHVSQSNGSSVVVEVPAARPEDLTRRNSYHSAQSTQRQSITKLQQEDSSLTVSDYGESLPQSSQASRSSLPNLKGRDLFDAMIWSEAFTTSIFYMFISTLRQRVNEVQETTETHKFLKVLRDGGRLVRNYTQNIDRLEEKVGLSTNLADGPGNRARFHSKIQREARPAEIEKDSVHCGGVETVLLHGSLGKLRCGICTKLSEWDMEREATTLAGRAPDCPSCTEYNAKRTGRGRRGLAVGRLRPDIVLYGEEHPQSSLISPLVTHDLSLGPDVLLIMGTSLKVHGLKIMVREFAKAVHTKGGKVIFVNNTKPSESQWGDIIDYWVQWDCDAWVVDLRERRSDIWLPQGSVINRRESLTQIKRTQIKRQVTDNRKRERRSDPARDDKLSGVYVTFKILDQLRELKDDKQPCTRKQYRKIKSKLPPYINPNISVVIDSCQSQTPPSLAAKSTKKPVKRVGQGSKRKSLPTTPQHDGNRYQPQVIIDQTWVGMRKKNPDLPRDPPQISPGILAPRCQNIPTKERGLWGHAPNLWGLGLESHPPSDPQAAEMVRAKMRNLARQRHPLTNHAYGTRSSLGNSTDPSLQPRETSQIYPGYPHDQGVRPPLTPPTSHPCSDASDHERRIKRLGSIGSILSPIQPVQDEEEVESDQSLVFYDAQETPG